jgi:hypothetical protein
MNDSAKTAHQSAPTAETAEAPAPPVPFSEEKLKAVLPNGEPRPAAPMIEDRIEEYQHAALQEKSPLRAILGAYNAELMAIGSRVQQAVLAHLETGPGDLKRIAPVLRLIETGSQNRPADRPLRAARTSRTRSGPQNPTAARTNRLTADDRY